MNREQKRQLYSLLSALREDIITDEQFAELDDLVRRDAEAAREYVRYVNIWTDLYFFQMSSPIQSADPLTDEICESSERFTDSQLWQQLCEAEKRAPAIEILKSPPPRTPIPKVVYEKSSHTVDRFRVFTAVLSAAALFFLILFVHFGRHTGGQEVATLTDSLDVKWGGKGSLQKGSRLKDNKAELLMQEGLAELSFDNRAKLIIEAPASFRIIAEDRIELQFGKVYATIPQEAIGFSVYTPNAKIVDLGTEFGVQTEPNGDTLLHVLKGRTVLMAGASDNKINVEVEKGVAKRVSGDTQLISDIPCEAGHFVRAFDSQYQVVWREQPSLDLADIVSNGNGLGTGNPAVRLNHEKGFTNEQRPGYTSVFKDYLPVSDHAFIDGIFIPNRNAVVSSRGDVYEAFPHTNGVYCADLFASPEPGLVIIDGQPRPIQFDGQEYSDRGRACIVMQNSNHGITFDLNAIRDRYHLKIDRFTSRVGLIEFDNRRCNANFYVLVDGQPRYTLLGYSQKGVLNDVTVPLEDTDRFLTLATCENVDQTDYMANSTLFENWCLFAEPVLVFK